MNDLSTALGRVKNALASNLGADGVLVLAKGDVAELLALIDTRAPLDYGSLDAVQRLALCRGDMPVAAPAVPELTPELRWILGQMCFQCIHTAQALRLMGHQIARKAEDEQAVTIYWMLGHYLKDPANWRDNAAAEMKAAAPKA